MKVTKSRIRQLINESIQKILKEDWQDTSWKNDDVEVTIGDVDRYLGPNMIDIDIRELVTQMRKPPSEIITSQERVDMADFGKYKENCDTDERDPSRDWIWFPVYVLKQDGKFLSVLDGNHRLEKAVQNNYTVHIAKWPEGVQRDFPTIKAKVLDLDDPNTPEDFISVLG